MTLSARFSSGPAMLCAVPTRLREVLYVERLRFGTMSRGALRLAGGRPSFRTSPLTERPDLIAGTSCSPVPSAIAAQGLALSTAIKSAPVDLLLTERDWLIGFVSTEGTHRHAIASAYVRIGCMLPLQLGLDAETSRRCSCAHRRIQHPLSRWGRTPCVHPVCKDCFELQTADDVYPEYDLANRDGGSR
jgi:hypothetical protein